MLIRFLSGPKSGETKHVRQSQETQLLIDAGLAEQVIISPAEEKRLRFPDANGKPMEPAQIKPVWLANRSASSGKPQLVLVTPLIKEVVNYNGELEKAEEFFTTVCGGAYARFCPIPKEALKAYAAELKADNDAAVSAFRLEQEQMNTPSWKAKR